MKWIARVVRKQEWIVEVEADSEKQAKDIADAEVSGTDPDDDYAYETTVRPRELCK